MARCLVTWLLKSIIVIKKKNDKGVICHCCGKYDYEWLQKSKHIYVNVNNR